LIDLARIPVVNFNEGTTIRLISTAYTTVPALSPLADDDEDLRILEDVEMMTSVGRDSLVAIPPGVNPNELLSETQGFGWIQINAAFCFTRSTGNRFNGPKRGAWYAAWDDKAPETSQTEVAYHLTRELDYVGVYENLTVYRELLAGFATRFYDLDSFADQDFLGPDTQIAYPAGQSLARLILQTGGNGVLYPSVRYSGGQCLAAFRPHIIQNVRHGQTWKFEWSGKRNPTISTT
jgi:hypothetical protein